ncbi:MAG: DUF721 domain-containing protein [Rhizobiales bacterium]|nr:DUF721 domain-containing protein [Hyphomicrobiales bacterium]
MQSLHKPFRDLTQAAFARYGFAYGELLSQWAAIVGEDIAGVCRPDKISWPRQPGDASRRQGGTLILRADPGRALELHYDTPRLIERINAFYGYAAIAAIKLREAPRPVRTARTKPAPTLGTARRAALDAELAQIGDESLRNALCRLGTGALSRCKSSQQDQ